MYRLLLVIVLAFTSCANEEYVKDVAGQTLHDNENLLYDNYRYAVFNKGRNVTEIKWDETGIEKKACTDSCVSRPLHIGVMPMGFSRPEVLAEIKNTVALVQTTQPAHICTIQILDSKNPQQELIAFSPDVIVGPFLETDLRELERYISETALEKTPAVIALTKHGKNKSRHFLFTSHDALSQQDSVIYQMGYNAESDISSLMNTLSKHKYQNFAMFAMHDDIGASLYKDFSKIANENKQDVSRVEFYESDLTDIEKYLSRLKKAVKQTYYQHETTGKIKEDTHSFTKDIKMKEGDTVVLKNDARYAIKYRILDAIILDVDRSHILTLLEAIANDETLKNIVLVATPRTVDAIVNTAGDARYANIPNTILFPAHYGLYSAYHNVYKNTFGKAPTRVSSTLYEILLYTIKNQERYDIKEGFDPSVIPVYVGLNGTLVVDKNGTTRYVNVSKMERGRISEIVDTYKTLRK